MTKPELDAVLAAHEDWLFGRVGGSRADLRGALIYGASRPTMRVPDFYADNETALASTRADAAVVT